jgi:hypothetical protein
MLPSKKALKIRAIEAPGTSLSKHSNPNLIKSLTL